MVTVHEAKVCPAHRSPRFWAYVKARSGNRYLVGIVWHHRGVGRGNEPEHAATLSNARRTIVEPNELTITVDSDRAHSRRYAHFRRAAGGRIQIEIPSWLTMEVAEKDLRRAGNQAALEGLGSASGAHGESIIIRYLADGTREMRLQDQEGTTQTLTGIGPHMLDKLDTWLSPREPADTPSAPPPPTRKLEEVLDPPIGRGTLKSTSGPRQGEARRHVIPNESLRPGPLLSSRPPARFTAPVDGVRLAFGAHGDDRLAMHLLLDRSGSVTIDPHATDQQIELEEMFSDLEGIDNRNTVAITGFDGTGYQVNLYELKLPGEHNGSIYGLPDTGGATAPTELAVPYATEQLSATDSEHKVMLIVVDDVGFNWRDTYQRIREAREAGITVIGARVSRSPARKRELDAHFGVNGWFSTDSYQAIPKAMLDHQLRTNALIA